MNGHAKLTGNWLLKTSYLHTMRSVVADENLILVIGDDAVRELEMTGAAELVQHGAIAIKHDHTHHLCSRARRSQTSLHNNTMLITAGLVA